MKMKILNYGMIIVFVLGFVGCSNIECVNADSNIEYQNMDRQNMHPLDSLRYKFL